MLSTYIIDSIRATLEGKLAKGECFEQHCKASINQMKVEDNVFINVCFVSLVDDSIACMGVC